MLRKKKRAKCPKDNKAWDAAMSTGNKGILDGLAAQYCGLPKNTVALYSKLARGNGQCTKYCFTCRKSFKVCRDGGKREDGLLRNVFTCSKAGAVCRNRKGEPSLTCKTHGGLDSKCRRRRRKRKARKSKVPKCLTEKKGWNEALSAGDKMTLDEIAAKYCKMPKDIVAQYSQLSRGMEWNGQCTKYCFTCRR